MSSAIARSSAVSCAIASTTASSSSPIVRSAASSRSGGSNGARCSPNSLGDFVGTDAAPIDPLLLPLEYNADAFTASHRPVLDASSPVIDHGFCPGSGGDQLGRGSAATHLRIVPHPTVPDAPASDGCDIGSFERGAVPDVAPELFADGFELGHTLLWSAEAP